MSIRFFVRPPHSDLSKCPSDLSNLSKKSDNCLTGGWVSRVDRVSRFKFVITDKNNFLKITLPTPEMKKELLDSQVEVYFEL